MSLLEKMSNVYNNVVECWNKPTMHNVFRLGMLWCILYVIVASLIIILAAASFPQSFIIVNDDTEVITDSPIVIDLRFLGVWSMYGLYGLDAAILIMIAYFARLSLRYRETVKKWKAFYDEHHPQNA